MKKIKKKLREAIAIMEDLLDKEEDSDNKKESIDPEYDGDNNEKKITMYRIWDELQQHIQDLSSLEKDD